MCTRLWRACTIFAALAAVGAPARGEPEPPPRWPVIGGAAVSGPEYAATGALVRQTDGEAVVTCTATAVYARTIITAAHCRSDWPLFFAVGGEEYAVTATRVHPDFDPDIGEHDIAVLRLDGPISGSASLPLLFEGTPLEPGSEVELAGYGPTTVGTAAQERGLNAARAAVDEVRETEFVVGVEDDIEYCGGDSGGPAFVRGAGEVRVVGIASRAVDRDARCVGGSVLTRLEGERAFLEEALTLLDSVDSPGCSVSKTGARAVSGWALSLCAAVAAGATSARARLRAGNRVQ